MADTWSTYDMHKDGQTDWLVHLYETVINGIRANQLPSEVDDEYTLSAIVPNLAEQAQIMRFREPRPPGNNIPGNRGIEFIEKDTTPDPMNWSALEFAIEQEYLWYKKHGMSPASFVIDDASRLVLGTPSAPKAHLEIGRDGCVHVVI